MSERSHTDVAPAQERPERPRTERPDPRLRPPDPAGTRPKFDPDALRPSGDFLALPPGEIATDGDEDRLPKPAPAAAPPAIVAALSNRPHTPRFQFLLGALGTLGVAAIALAVSLALRPSPHPGVPWATWRPSSSGGDTAEQIAAHVAPEYSLSAGHRLVGISGGPQAISGQPVVVALRKSGSAPEQLPENGVFYQLCGSGPNCSIPGKPSLQRGLLVRREALELALYTFHYISSASQVIVTFPPLPPSSSSGASGSKRSSGSSGSKGSKGPSKSGASSSGGSSSTPSSSTSSSSTVTPVSGSPTSTSAAPSRVLLFRPSDLEQELSSPLSATLSGVTPTVTDVSASADADLINTLTENLLYDSVLIPEQQSSAVLLLQPPSIGG